MSTSEFARRVFTMVADSSEVKRQRRDFEMAYQARVAADRIRFAIRGIEKPGNDAAALRQIGLQLLDALDRLESAERHFQQDFRGSAEDQTSREEVSA